MYLADGQKLECNDRNNVNVRLLLMGVSGDCVVKNATWTRREQACTSSKGQREKAYLENLLSVKLYRKILRQTAQSRELMRSIKAVKERSQNTKGRVNTTIQKPRRV